MKVSLFKGIQFKVLRAFVLSMFLSSVITLFLLLNFLRIVYGVTYANWGPWSNQHINKNACILLVFFIIFVLITAVFFYTFSRKIIYQINSINKSIEQIANGNFNIVLPINAADEISQIANNINIMSQKLDNLVKKERENENIKNAMISNISHDLRTPLTSVIGYVEVMQNLDYRDKSTNDKCINTILHKCDELKNLIEDLLEYTSINSKGVNIKKESISITDIVEQVIIGFIPILEKNGISFNIEAQNEKILIIGDVSLIVRLFENIINNSIFYGKDGKKINIKIKAIGNMVSVKITNYGKKIPIEDQPYIFERFYRSEKSRNSNTGGKGMGLAIAKSIATIHNGDIRVDSNDFETSFEILLPKETVK